MASNLEVLKFLRPNGGYVQVGYDYEGIVFSKECKPFTKEEYIKAFDLVDENNKKLENERQLKKEIAEQKLNALGLTLDDLKALGF